MKKKVAVYTLLSSMMFSTLALTTTVHAESYDSQIEETQNQIQENENTINQLNESIRGLQAEQSATEAELNSVNNTIAANEDKIKKLVVQLQASQKEMETLQAEIEVLNENIAQRNEQLEGQARTVQVDGDPANYIEFIVEAESLSDVMGRVDVITSLVRANKTLVQEQKRDKDLVEVKKVRTEETINQQNATAGQLEDTGSALEQQRLEKEVLVAQLAADRSTAQSDKDAHLAQKAEAESRVASYVSAKLESEQAAKLAYAQRQEETELEEVAQVVTSQDQDSSSQSSGDLVASGQTSGSASSDSSNNSNNSTQTAPSVTPSTPAPSKPATPAPSKPATPAPSKPATPAPSKPATPAPSKPAAPAPSKPATPAPSKPAAPAPSKPATPAPSKPATPAPAPSGGASWANLKSHANSWLGTSYLYGGSTANGIDCSGFTTNVFRKVGINLSRSAAGQYAGSTKVSSPVPGDLVFFAANPANGRVTHVGIYVGGGQFIGSQTSTGVAYSSVHTSYWGPRLVGYGRY